MIEQDKPDLLLLDIVLAGNKDGIELGAFVRENFGTPFVFLTANSDSKTIIPAKVVQPYAYLVKPFTPDELFAAIEIATVNNAERQALKTSHTSSVDEYIFVKQYHAFHKLLFKNITWVQSIENYVVIYTVDKGNFMIRSTFQQFLLQFKEQQLFRLHRSYAVNPQHVESIEEGTVTIGGNQVPAHKAERERLIELLNLR